MTAQARVRQLHADHTVQLDILEPPRCSGCERSCIWRWAPASSLRVRSSLALQPDELVTISVDRRYLLLGSLVLHGLPWAGLLAGVVVGISSIGGDLGALVGSVAGLAGGSILARRRQDRWRIAPVLARAGQ